MISDFIRRTEPVEHRGIVLAPLFPRRTAAAAYLTLDDASGRGLRVTELDAAGNVPELAELSAFTQSDGHERPGWIASPSRRR